MVDDITSVLGFKEHIKQLSKASKFKDAIAFANVKFEASCFEELQLREEVTLVHWWTKAYWEGGDLRNTTTKCLTRVNTMINKVQTSSPSTFVKANDTSVQLAQIEVDQCLAELLYLKRTIETQAMLIGAETSLDVLSELMEQRPECKTDLLVVKYYIKSLLKNDEYQLGVDTKVGYQQLLKAQRLDQEILVRKHSHTKETIKVQINKMQKFKNFMDVKSFAQLSATAMGTHRQKPEVVQIMRALAIKYSDLGDHKKAMDYISRVETLA